MLFILNVHHLKINRPCDDLKDYQSEDDDDSIRDRNNYEALSDEACSSDNEPIFSKHVVGDSDLTETTLENKVYKGRSKKRKKKEIRKSKQD